jgi:endoglucanase
MYVDPASHASVQAGLWRRTRPADAAVMDKIAAQPQALWFGAWGTDVRADVATRVAAAQAVGAIPLLVAYNIPRRECRGPAYGGAPSPAAYRGWIAAFGAGLGQGRAAVILEPDALPGIDCLSRRDQHTRLVLLRYAVSVLTADPNAAVYLDAGNRGWRSARAMGSLLRRAGVRHVRGFSVNISNFDPTRREVAYGRRISRRIHSKPFVIDTSRNGVGPTRNRQFCNPPGRALGPVPTAAPARRVDAFLWIKPPGESDGRCNGGPPAGAWWPDYALGLARRAGW